MSSRYVKPLTVVRKPKGTQVLHQQIAGLEREIARLRTQINTNKQVGQFMRNHAPKSINLHPF